MPPESLRILPVFYIGISHPSLYKVISLKSLSVEVVVRRSYPRRTDIELDRACMPISNICLCSHSPKTFATMLLGMQYLGSTGSMPGYPSKLSPAVPKHVCQTSTMLPGPSEKPPFSGS